MSECQSELILRGLAPMERRRFVVQFHAMKRQATRGKMRTDNLHIVMRLLWPQRCVVAGGNGYGGGIDELGHGRGRV